MPRPRLDPAPLFAASVALALAVFVRPSSVPDGPEMASAGACLLRMGLDAAACAGAEPFFWMPAFPLLAGLVSLGTDPWTASHAAAALATGMLVVPLAAIGRRLAVPAPAALAAALLLATPAMHDLVSQPSGRALAWVGILGAVALATGLRDAGTQPLRRGAAIGALLALAVLSRREAALQAAVVGLATLALAPRAGLAAVGTGSLLTAPWFALLAAGAGAPRMGGRAWEPIVYAWDAVVPHEWLLMEISMGTWGTPLRHAVSRLSPASGLEGLDPTVLLPWLRYALPVAVPAWLAVAAAAGAVLLARRAGGWRPLGVAIVLGLPALPLAIVPNARAVELPAQNLHPVVLACIVPAMVTAGVLMRLATRRLPAGRWSAPTALALALAGASAANAAWVARVVPMDHLAPATLPAAGAALASGEAPVATTLNAAPAARRADRPRVALPSPYRLTVAPLEPGSDLLLTNLDLPGARRSLDGLAGGLAPRHVLVDGAAWAVRFEVTAPEGGSEATAEQPLP